MTGWRQHVGFHVPRGHPVNWVCRVLAHSFWFMLLHRPALCNLLRRRGDTFVVFARSVGHVVYSVLQVARRLQPEFHRDNGHQPLANLVSERGVQTMGFCPIQALLTISAASLQSAFGVWGARLGVAWVVCADGAALPCIFACLHAAGGRRDGKPAVADGVL